MSFLDLDPDCVTTTDVIEYVATAVNWSAERVRDLLRPVADKLLHMPAAERQEVLIELAGDTL